MSNKTKMLVTGAGGPAAISFMRSLPGFEFFAADMDPYAAGLYLVPEGQRFLIPAGTDAGLVDRLLDICQSHDIDVLVPTVDSELRPISKRRSEFEAVGTRCLLSPNAALDVCLDKWNLVGALRPAPFLPRTELLTEATSLNRWEYPFIAKPRAGSGSRGVRLISAEADLRGLTRDGSLIVQEYLPGPEYSVDVLVPRHHKPVAVPRERLKVDSGVAVTARVVRDGRLESLASEIVERLGLRHVSNVQFRRDGRGRPRLLEINPRFPGTMSLTVASGVNMPEIAVKGLLGIPVAAAELNFADVSIVRTWQEHVVSGAEIDNLILQQEHRLRVAHLAAA